MISPLVKTAWGKLSRESDKQLSFLELSSHCADVAAVTVRLLELPVWRRRFEALAGRPLGPPDIALLGLIAYLHDLGKCATGFWLKQFDRNTDDGGMDTSIRRDIVRAIGGDIGECGHTSVVTTLFWSDDLPVFKEHPLAEIFKQESHGKLLIASISHHGQPVDANSRFDFSWTWKPVPQLNYDPSVELEHLLDTAAKTFPLALHAGGPLPEAERFVHGFCGLVSLADWIGSNPNAAFFPYDLAPVDNRYTAAYARAAEVLRRMRIDCVDATAYLRNRSLSFGDVFFDPNTKEPYRPTGIQAAACNLDLGPLVIIEDETGAGKTEAALWRFKRLFEAGEVDSLVFCLPTRVSAVALSKRVEAFIRRVFPDDDIRLNTVTAVPGYLVSDGLIGERLARFEFLWPDSDKESSAHRHWAAENSKRYLAAAVAVGTIDQALLAGLKTRHAHLRGAALLRSLLVVDEVHASDVYMTRILKKLLARHIEAGGHALLLSATLGNSARSRFLELVESDDRTNPSRQTGHDHGRSAVTPYPAISSARSMRGFGPALRQKRVAVELVPILGDAAAIADVAAAAATAGARVLVVQNTVNQAIDVHRELEQNDAVRDALFRCNGQPCPHHGRFAAVDRKVLDAQVERLFGKRSPGGPRVLVGTQTLEQSLDIDADLLISDLCPMDVLLQRIGRLHRHRRSRPKGFEAPKLILLVPRERDLERNLSQLKAFGLGSVYENLLSIEATWRELEERAELTIPDDNRELVEQATDYDRLETLAAELGSKWEESWRELLGAEAAQRQHAIPHLLDWDDDFSVYSENTEVLTRLGNLPRLVKFAETRSPFNLPLTELQIPHHLWPEGCDETEVETERTGDVMHFRMSDRSFSYSRLGLAYSRTDDVDL